MSNTYSTSITKKPLFDAKAVFDPEFVSFYSNLIHIICGISMFLTFLLTYIIINKTPQFMSNLKVYLIPYCIYSFIIEIVFLTYTPMILHPFTYFYPTGIVKYFHPKLAIVFVAFGATAAISLIDCSIGTILERAFVLRNVEKFTNGLSNIFIPYLNLTMTFKIPFSIYVVLTFSCFCCFFAAILETFVQPLYAYFLVPPEDIPNVVGSHINGLEKFINLEVLLVFQGADKNTLPVSIIFVGLFATIRVVITGLLIPYTGYKSYKLQFVMSSETKKSNLMLLKMCFLQFTGFAFFIGLPVFILTLIFWFNQSQNIYVNYCFVVMNFFSIYDSIITILCIKPYRMFVFSFFKFGGKKQTQITTVVIPSFGR